MSSGSLFAQLAVLRDILKDPLRATALGKHQDEDLVDLLLRLVVQSLGPVKQAQILCLMCFDDARVSDYLMKEFECSQDPATLLHLGKRLSLLCAPEFFRRFLWDSNSARALAAARQCTQGLELSPQERLRVAIVLDQPFSPPPLQEDTLELWLQAMSGRDRLKVRSLAAQQGEQLLLLWSRFDHLQSAEQDWLVTQTAQLDPSRLASELPRALLASQVSPLWVEYALRLGLPLPGSLLENTQPQVRAAAIAAGLADHQLEKYLTPEASGVEAAAATRRCLPKRLLELCAHPGWEVRAAATETLSRLDPHELPLPALQQMALSGEVGARAAAVELLTRLGQFEWLEQHLTPQQLGTQSNRSGPPRSERSSGVA